MERLSRIGRAHTRSLIGALVIVPMALFVALDVGVSAAPSPNVNRANTVILSDAPGGPEASQQLFAVGAVSVFGSCAVRADGSVEYKVGVTNHAGHQVLLAGGQGPPFSQVLSPDEQEAIIADAAETGPTAHQTSFAIMNKGGVSASGLAAASGHPGSRRCVFTAQAAG